MSEPLFDFDAVEGGEVVEGEREEGFHCFWRRDGRCWGVWGNLGMEVWQRSLGLCGVWSLGNKNFLAGT